MSFTDLTRPWIAVAIAAAYIAACPAPSRANSPVAIPGDPFLSARAIDATLPFHYAPGVHLRQNRPHPAVARVIVPEAGATSYGSGTLIDVRDQFGLVVTNWHVVRDGMGEVEVLFPDGFRSKARPLKVDADWDLAALVIWRPPASPVTIAQAAPQAGDQLTICGYGQGDYRSATGRCTQYYSPKVDLPQHMVELDVEARQGDSGGPIFNERGELAGVLFGAGHGTTLGSFGGQVGSFLATLAPDIGCAANSALVLGAKPAPPCEINGCHGPDRLVSLPALTGANACDGEACGRSPASLRPESKTAAKPSGTGQLAALWTDASGEPANDPGWRSVPASADSGQTLETSSPPDGSNLVQHAKTVLAVIGALAVAVQILRVVA